MTLLGSCPDVSSVCVMCPGGAGLVTVTRAVCAIAAPFALAVTVTVWTSVEDREPPVTPLGSVGPAGSYNFV